MKKFLTVLLVIAVMFTFSFSSAFATAPTPEHQFTLAQVEAKIDTAATAAKNANEALASSLLSTLFGTATTATGSFSVDGAAATEITLDKAVVKAKQPFEKSLSILEAPLQCV